MRKVFGIGLSKTGTTSLSAALAILGYRSKHFPKDEDFAHYDAFSDITVAMKFKTLDRFFPGSQFIYTVRDEPSWLASCARHFRQAHEKERQRDIRRTFYKCGKFDEEKFREAYWRHDADVRTYFRDRQADMLVLDIREGWGPLCRFLGRVPPAQPFPWQNKTFEKR
jgi:hypothetical protein